MVLALERIEERILLAVTLGQDGWHQFAPSADSRIVYVSAAQGSDANDGLSIETPLKTLDAGKALIRDGMPDWLLLERGSVWENESLGMWNYRSGRSPQEPILIGAYGAGDRPMILPPTGSRGFRVTTGISNVAIVGVGFYAHTRDPESSSYTGTDSAAGIDILDYTGEESEQWILIEDVYVSMFSSGIAVYSYSGFPTSDLAVRRSVIVDSYNVGGHSQGLFVYGVDGITIEENVFDHNGWYGDRDSGGVVGARATQFNHNVYIDNENPEPSNTLDQRDNIVVRGNVFSRASASGIQLRPGGTLEDNLFVRNAVVTLGSGDGFETSSPEGVDVDVARNVILEGVDIRTDQLLGYGFQLRNARIANLENNIIAHDISSGYLTRGLVVGRSEAEQPSISLAGNIFYDWDRGVPRDVNGFVLTEISNYYWDAVEGDWPITGTNVAAETVPFVDPNRSVASYNGYLGGAATFDAFIDGVRAQSKDSWDDRYTAFAVNDYIRDGFELQLPPADIVGRSESGQWWMAQSLGDRFVNSYWGTWSDLVDWEVRSGDFNGDGNTDLIGFTEGQWWVARSTGDRFVTTLWDKWAPGVTWTDLRIADLDGDGRDDIMARAGDEWWVAKSNGSQFLDSEMWGRWSDRVEWVDILVGDFDGDGRDDLLGRTGGDWYLMRSTGDSFTVGLGARWSANAGWQNTLVGDFNGDGRDDVASSTGAEWWVATSTGEAFSTSFWGTWQADSPWLDVKAGDFDRDGRTDIVGRAEDGKLWVARSTGADFSVEVWGGWSPSFGWSDFQVADFSGDGRDDVAARGGNGEWWVGVSDGNLFQPSRWGYWSSSVTWRDVKTGNFDIVLAAEPLLPGDDGPVGFDERLLGDADKDGEVSFSDFLILAANFGHANSWWRDGDFDGSGTVDFQDFLALSHNFGDLGEVDSGFAPLVEAVDSVFETI